MTRIVIDDVLREKLIALKGTVELCDASGKVVARATPTSDASTYVGHEPRISEEEREHRRKYKGPMRTTEEVLKRLEEL